jgi:hypothetical protein
MIPTKPPTAAEYAVLAITISAALILFGAIALVSAFLISAKDHAAAAAQVYLGSWSIGLGLLVALSFWLARRFKN